MKKIEDFLSRFKLIQDPSKEKSKIAENINKILGINLTEENIKVFNYNTVQINIHPTIKSVIFIKKEGLIKQIEEVLSKKNIKLTFK